MKGPGAILFASFRLIHLLCHSLRLHPQCLSLANNSAESTLRTRAFFAPEIVRVRRQCPGAMFADKVKWTGENAPRSSLPVIPGHVDRATAPEPRQRPGAEGATPASPLRALGKNVAFFFLTPWLRFLQA